MATKKNTAGMKRHYFGSADLWMRGIVKKYCDRDYQEIDGHLRANWSPIHQRHYQVRVEDNQARLWNMMQRGWL